MEFTYTLNCSMQEATDWLDENYLFGQFISPPRDGFPNFVKLFVKRITIGTPTSDHLTIEDRYWKIHLVATLK